MRRQSPHAQRRSRVLDDDEIRKVWLAAETGGTYGALVRMLLLTAQRRDKVLTMAWTDLLENRAVWKISTESPREKPHGGLLKLPPQARDILAGLPVFDRNPFVFAGLKGYINGHSKAKARLDADAGVTGWTLHDLRRTARTLMSRAGVVPDTAERTLGHALPGIRGNYDWYGYVDEKADALARLAALIDSIVHQSPAVVVPLESKRSRRSR
jgi:integrase